MLEKPSIISIVTVVCSAATALSCLLFAVKAMVHAVEEGMHDRNAKCADVCLVDTYPSAAHG